MRRRDFLKGIFGAAAIAAVPTIVLRQIDALPPPPEKVDAVGKIYTGPITYTIKVDPNSIPILYIWDGERNELVGASTDFSLNMHLNPIDVSQWGDVYPTYMAGTPSWDVHASQMQWRIDPRELFERQPTQLQCLMAKDGMKFCGNVYLSQLALVVPIYEESTYGAIFEGSGILEMTIEKG